MTIPKRTGVGRVFGRAALGPLNLAVLGGAALGTLVIGWPLAALGGAAYVALVAADISSPDFRKRVLRLAPPTWPTTFHDAEVRSAVARIVAARAALDDVVRATPARVQRNIASALATVDELERHGAALAIRGDALARYLTGVDRAAARRDADALAARAKDTRDATARARYEAAAQTAAERVAAIDDIAVAHDRVLAHLAELEAALAALPAKLVRLRALDDQVSDALLADAGSDLGGELARINGDLGAFEHTLADLVEVP